MKEKPPAENNSVDLPENEEKRDHSATGGTLFSWKAMSTGEKYFWGTILFFLVPFLVVTVIAMINSVSVTKKRVEKEPIIQIREADLMKRNISKAEPEILADLIRKEAEANRTVDAAVDRVFVSVYGNIDRFLDYHYSIRGEYAELGHAASNNIDLIVKEKLFGKAFETNFRKAMDDVAKRFAELLKAHGRLVGKIAMENVDVTLNEALLETIEFDIAKNITMTAATFIGVVGGAKLASRIAPKITAKFLSKVGTKLAAKVGAKTAGKVAAAETGAASSVLCGPFVWVCAPIFATTAWFATDAIVIKADEMITRDTFRKEILSSLDEEKSRIKIELKSILSAELKKFSLKIRKRYESQPVKVREMIYGSDAE